MKTFISLLVAAVLACPLTAAHADVIALYGDVDRSSCHSFQLENFYLLFYVYHYSPSGATGSSFRIPIQGCLVDISGPWLSYHPFPTSGFPADGISVSYGECLSGWIHILTVAYHSTFFPGFPWCCEQPVTAHPSAASGQVEVIDCSGSPQVAIGASGIYEGNETCPCIVVSGILDEQSQATWGAIKALFASE